MQKYLDKLHADGVLNDEQYSEALKHRPHNPEAWTARETAHAEEVARITKERDAALAREAAKDKIIVTFSTQSNPNSDPDGDPMNEVVEYINKKRGIKHGN